MKVIFIDQQVLNSPATLDSDDSGYRVLTIGNFDGVHLGHQQMLNASLEIAQKQGLSSAVMMFEPMPKEFFSPNTAPARLMNCLESQYIFANYQYNNKQINELFIVDFNKDFQSLSALEFAQLLINRLKVTAVVIGDDFRFGNDRIGDGEFLQKLGLSVHTLATVTDSDTQERISSTRIRQLLQQGQLQQANTLLGRDYCMMGKVQHGDKIGRTLNFPTANIALDRLKPSLQGVFAVDVQVLDDNHNLIENAWQQLAIEDQHGITGLAEHSLFGTANIGTRPSVNGVQWRLEVHFPQFQGDLYDKLLKVRFLHFLHGERRYNGLAELQTGIANDVKELIAWRQSQS